MLEAAVKELPESSDLNVSLGVVFSQQKYYGQSAQYFEKAHLRDPNDLNVWSNLAEVYLSLNRSDLKQIEKAEAEFRKILKNAPDHIDSRIGLGETYAAWQRQGKVIILMRPSNTIATLSDWREDVRVRSV